jgi:hypothetical protein
MRRKSTTQRLKQSIKDKKIHIEVEKPLLDNRASFNFILKEHNNGVIYMGSQIDTCFYIVYPDELGNY